MPLTTREVELLRYLAANPSRVIPRDELLAQVWGYAGTVMSRASDNTVRRLREKIERDPAHPDHLLTVHGVGYRFEPLPPAQPVQALVGRAQLVAEVGARLAPGRWVLLVGPGGVGKSALARACAPDATWVDLGGAATLHEAAAQAARALGIELGADDPVDRVGRALTGRTGRLVLDHADGLGPALLARWGGPGVEGLCTSRVRFDAEGLWVVEVGPLDRDSGVALFVERARAASVHARLDDLVTIGEVVDRAEGIPLAIELAAARTGTMGLADLRDRLTGDLAALVDHAVRSLPDEGRIALAALAPLRDGFTLDDAEAIVGPAALDLVQLLQDHCLVRRVDRTGHTARFTTWDAVRDLLRGTPPAPEAVRRRCARLGRWADALDRLEADRDEVDALSTQLGDVTRAVADAVANGDPAGAARCAAVVGWMANERGPARAGLEVVDAALAAGPGGRSLALLGLQRVALLTTLGRWEVALEEAPRAAAHAARADAPDLEGRIWLFAAELGLRAGDPEAARAAAERAAAAGRRSGRADGWVECCEAVGARCAGDRVEEEQRLRKARARAIDSGGRAVLLRAQVLLAACARDDGRAAEAARLYEDALGRAASAPSRRIEAVVTVQLAFLQSGLGDWTAAHGWAERASRLGRALGAVDVEALGLSMRASAERWLGRLDQAERTLDQAELLLGEGPAFAEPAALVSVVRGHVARERGDGPAAVGHAERAEAGYAQCGHRGGVELARVDQALGWLSAGQLGRARAVERPAGWGRGMAATHLAAEALLAEGPVDLEPLRAELRRSDRIPPDDDAELVGSVLGRWAGRWWHAHRAV